MPETPIHPPSIDPIPPVPCHPIHQNASVSSAYQSTAPAAKRPNNPAERRPRAVPHGPSLADVFWFECCSNWDPIFFEFAVVALGILARPCGPLCPATIANFSTALHFAGENNPPPAWFRIPATGA